MAARVREKLFKKREIQEQNLFVLWFGTSMTGVGFSLVMSFMSFYIDMLGNHNTTQLSFQSGLAFSSTFLVITLIPPWWGKLADQKGGKLMLLRVSLGMVIVISLTGCVTSVHQLVALRLPQGIFSGYISNATALVVTGTPKEKSGQVLGILATDSIAGTLLGPLLGGISTSAFDHHPISFITGIISFFVFLLSLLFVHEKFVPVKKGNMVPAKQIFRGLKYPRVIIDMFITTVIIQTSNNFISPIISLYVRQLLHGHGSVTLTSRIIASIPGVATSIAAPRFGRLGDKIGNERILVIGLGFVILVYIPMAFVMNVWQLTVLHLLIGISDACLFPVVQVLIMKYSSYQAAGRISSYSRSLQVTSNVAGPMIGSNVSSVFGHRGVFLPTSFLVLINFLPVRHNAQEIHQ